MVKVINLSEEHFHLDGCQRNEMISSQLEKKLEFSRQFLDHRQTVFERPLRLFSFKIKALPESFDD